PRGNLVRPQKTRAAKIRAPPAVSGLSHRREADEPGCAAAPLLIPRLEASTHGAPPASRDRSPPGQPPDPPHSPFPPPPPPSPPRPPWPLPPHARPPPALRPNPGTREGSADRPWPPLRDARQPPPVRAPLPHSHNSETPPGSAFRMASPQGSASARAGPPTA